MPRGWRNAVFRYGCDKMKFVMKTQKETLINAQYAPSDLAIFAIQKLLEPTPKGSLSNDGGRLHIYDGNSWLHCDVESIDAIECEIQKDVIVLTVSSGESHIANVTITISKE